MTVRLSGPARPRGLPSLDRRLLRSRARRLLGELGQTRSELSVTLADDEQICELNASYRHAARPTDVLAFSLVEGDCADYRGPLLGEVVIGVERAASQARRARRSLDDELARLLIHGVLHLLGHDHQRQAEARAMRAEERRLWRVLRE